MMRRQKLGPVEIGLCLAKGDEVVCVCLCVCVCVRARACVRWCVCPCACPCPRRACVVVGKGSLAVLV